MDDEQAIPSRPTQLSTMLMPAMVQVDVDAPSRKRAFDHAAALFEQVHGIAARDVSDRLFERERLGSTSLGCGVAIPHARVARLRTPLAAVLRLRRPIAYDGPDGDAVWLLMFMLVPQVATEQHLQALSEIAEMLSDEALRAGLLSADAAELHRRLVAWRPPAG